MKAVLADFAIWAGLGVFLTGVALAADALGRCV